MCWGRFSWWLSPGARSRMQQWGAGKWRSVWKMQSCPLVLLLLGENTPAIFCYLFGEIIIIWRSCTLRLGGEFTSLRFLFSPFSSQDESQDCVTEADVSPTGTVFRVLISVRHGRKMGIKALISPWCTQESSLAGTATFVCLRLS